RHRGRSRRSSEAVHRWRTLPFSVSKVLPPFLTACASGSAAEEPSTSLRLGPAGPRVAACCATLQAGGCIFSVFLWPFLSWSAICGGIPHLAELVWTYAIIFNSAWPKFLISFQDSFDRAFRARGAL